MSFFYASKARLAIRPAGQPLPAARVPRPARASPGWPRAGRALALVAVGALLLMNFSPVGQLHAAAARDAVSRPARRHAGALRDHRARRRDRRRARRRDTARSICRRARRASPRRRCSPGAIRTPGCFTPAAAVLRLLGSEAEEARDLLVGLGVARERIGIETRSRNTDENARFSAAILKPQPGQVWLARDFGLSHAALDGAVPQGGLRRGRLSRRLSHLWRRARLAVRNCSACSEL